MADTTRRSAMDVALRIAASRANPARGLEEALNQAIKLTDADMGYLIVGTSKAEDAIRLARNAGFENIPKDAHFVSGTLLANARDMGDSVVAAYPFDQLSGVLGRYELKSATLDAVSSEIRSVLVAPLVREKKMLGALVLHERNRKAPFTIEDRNVVAPLAQLAAHLLVEPAPAPREGGPPRLKAMPHLVGESPALKECLRQAEKIARSHTAALITGESGTGKELLAKFVHSRSPRAAGKFVPINVATLTEELIESELFGHTKGSFTGAVSDKDGLFAAADGGTLFLDEIGELPLKLQPVFLRTLQEKTYRRLGSAAEVKADVRLIAATNRDLYAMVAEKQFRLDLLMRLDVLKLVPPPLRDRMDDLPLLVEHLMERIARDENGRPKLLAKEAYERLSQYDWPGNVRELENVLRRAYVTSEGPTITRRDLDIREKMVVPTAPLPESTKRYLKLCMALQANGGDRAKAMADLEITKTTYYRWIKEASAFDPDHSFMPESARESINP